MMTFVLAYFGIGAIVALVGLPLAINQGEISNDSGDILLTLAAMIVLWPLLIWWVIPMVGFQALIWGLGLITSLITRGSKRGD